MLVFMFESCFVGFIRMAISCFAKKLVFVAGYADSYKAINDEGMPMYQRPPFMKGKLYIHFTVEFPETLSPDQVKGLETVFPAKPSSQLTDMELDECEETTLHDVNMEEETRRKQQQQQQEAYDEDDEMPGGAQRVQCAQQ